jgi:NADH:ubiquinone oxidoreductase subunit K
MSEAVVALIAAGLVVFSTGVYLLFVSHNLLRLVLAVEVLAKGVTLILLAAGVHRAAMPLTQALLAAALLAIVVVCQRINKSLDVRLLSQLKG